MLRRERLPASPACAGCAAPSALRALVRETRLDLDDFVMPLFVGPATEPNEALPAMGRCSVDELADEVERARRGSASRAVILFGIPDEKDDEGSGAWDDDGDRPARAARAARRASRSSCCSPTSASASTPRTATAACSTASEVDNDATLELLARTAVSHVEAGADAVCPSDMMDGRVAAIRDATLPGDADRRLLGQVRLRVLRAVPRGGRLDAGVRRPARLPDGSRPTSARRCASASSTSPRAPTCSWSSRRCRTST